MRLHPDNEYFLASQENTRYDFEYAYPLLKRISHHFGLTVARGKPSCCDPV